MRMALVSNIACLVHRRRKSRSASGSGDHRSQLQILLRCAKFVQIKY